MPNSADPALLDDPVWHALVGPHRRFARTFRQPPHAWRYRADVAPFAALSNAADPQAWAELAELCGADGRVALGARDEIRAPAGWTVVTVFQLAQMIGPAVATAAEVVAEPVVALGKNDVGEMTALVELTRPGPFAASTVELGGYLGVRREGRLVAMAGRRMQLPGWTEISAVCTHPEHRGQGLSRSLIVTAEAAIRREGHRAFLHVLHENVRAIELYRGLGFTTRADLTMTVLRPQC